MITKKTFFDKLKSEILLFDGAIGTQLQAMGLHPGESPEAWNLTHPDRIKEMHVRYIEAGAQVLTTNTFGGNQLKLEKTGLGDKLQKINAMAAELACKASVGKAWVAGSVGPTGEFIQPLGTVSREEMKEAFQQQITALMEGGADIIIIETMSALEEAVLAVEAAIEVGDFPIIGSMTFNPGKQGFRTMMGIDIPTAVKELLIKGADAVGSNCGNGIEDFISIVKIMRGETDKPILAEANAGLPKLENGETVYKETPEIMAEKLPLLFEAGTNIVGGCCGTTPEHIKRFRTIIEERQTH